MIPRLRPSKTPGLLPTAWLVLIALCTTAGASDEAVAPIDEIVAHERLRASVEEILAEARRSPSADVLPLGERLAALGPKALPFIADEIDNPDRSTYHHAVYAVGLIGTSESTDILRRSIASIDPEVEGRFAATRKGWALYALAVAGSADAFDLMEAKPPDVSYQEIFDRMQLPEVIAILTGREGVERIGAALRAVTLAKQTGTGAEAGAGDVDYLTGREGVKRKLPEFRRAAGAKEAGAGAEEESGGVDWRPIRRWIEALGGAGDERSIEVILPFLSDESDMLRAAAADALGRIGSPRVTDALIHALDDSSSQVAFSAATALGAIAPTEKRDELLARLETVEAAPPRQQIYAALARIGAPGTLEALLRYTNRPDPLDQVGLVRAIGSLETPEAIGALRRALQNPNLTVALQAFPALRALGTEEAMDTILSQVSSPQAPIALTATRIVMEDRITRAGPRIADRLLRVELASPVQDPSRGTLIERLAEALVTLRFHDPAADLKKALSLQTSPVVLGPVGSAIDRLERIASWGNSVERWAEAAGAEDPRMRKLAFDRLAEIGTADAVEALTTLFGRSSPEDGELIVYSIAEYRTAAAAPLVERILDDSAFDPPDRAPLRVAAAWAARRIGDGRMRDALRGCADRRSGREAPVLVYLALMDGKASIDRISRYRAPRLRYWAWSRALETAALDAIVRDLETGRSIARFDLPPYALGF